MVAQLYDWTLVVETDYEDVTAHGDEWEVVVPLKQRWSATAQAYLLTGATTYLSLFNAAGEPASLTFTAYAGLAAAGITRFVGTGFPTRVEMAAPMELVTQTIEIRGTGITSLAFS